MPNVNAIAGQLFARKLEAGTAIVGCFEASQRAPLVEGAAYVAMLTGAGLTIAPTPLDAGLPFEVEGQGIKAAVESEIWLRVSTQGAVIVRAFQSFEGSNWWTVYGVSDAGLGELPAFDHAGHAWLTLSANRVQNMPPPISAAGLTVAQPLGFAVWPGPDGEKYRLPQHPPRWCARYHELSLRLAAAGEDPAKLPEILAGLHRDPRLQRIAPYRPEAEYLRFLAAKKEAGMLVPEAPRTAAQARAEEAWTKDWVKTLYDEAIAA